MNYDRLDNSFLGLSFGYHDSNLTYFDMNKKLICLQEERFSRIKFDKSFPIHSLDYLASQVNLTSTSLTIMFYENPNLKRARQIKDLFVSRKIFDIPEAQLATVIHTSQKNFSNIILEKFKPYASVNQIKFVTHHNSHAASSFFSSPFDSAAVIVIDAVGEKISTSIWDGDVNKLKLRWKQNYPNSLGLFYSSFSNYCGFQVNSGEYKFMGLAPYGSPLYVDELFNNFITVENNGSIRLNFKSIGLGNIDKFDHSIKEVIFQMPKRKANDDILQFHADLAKSVQVVLEKAMVSLVLFAMKLTRKDKICLAGGVALNCVANQKIAELIGGNNLYVVPASGDSGTSLGALALGIVEKNLLHSSNLPWRLSLSGSKLGRSFSKNEVLKFLEEHKIKFSREDRITQLTKISNLLADGKVGAIFEGRSEFGPRALGNRSIIADPRIINGQIEINLRIKKRESFRPFAPIVLEEDAEKFFHLNFPSPYMLITAKVKNYLQIKDFKSENKLDKIDISNCLSAINSPLPGITHLDGSARVQTIKADDKCFISDLLKVFKEQTGCPVLINTSFNVRGEPIVDSPFDALNCLATTGLDFLWIEGFMIKREDLTKFKSTLFSSKLQSD
jgi:carbamoyltransferase